MADNVIRTISFRGTSEGLDELITKLKGVAAEEKNIALVSDDLSKRQISLAAAWKNTGLRLDENARNLDTYNRLVKQSDALRKQQGITDEQHADRVKLLSERYLQTATSAAKLNTGISAVTRNTADLTKQSSRNAAEMLNLGRQFADVGVSLQAGQSLLTVGIQQGAQIVDVFASSGRSVGQIFSSAANWAGRFIFSLGGMATAVLGVAAAALYMATSFASAQKEIDKTLAGGGGAASGATRTGINQIAESAAGRGTSIAEARETATAFAATGKIYSENIATATALTRDFALVMGIDAAKATKIFADALLDPKNGALELNKAIQFLDVTTLEHIRSLQTQGKLQEAQAAMMDALIPKLEKQVDKVGGLTKWWNDANEAVDKYNAASAKSGARLMENLTGAKFGGFSDEEQLDAAQKKQAAAQRALNQQQGKGFGTEWLKPYVDALRTATTEVERLQKALEEAAEATVDADFVIMETAVRKLEAAIVPAVGQVDQLKQALVELEMAKALGVAGPNADALTQILQKNLMIAQETIGVEQRKAAVFMENAAAYSHVSATTAQILATMDDQLKVAQAITGSAQMDAQYEATINQLKAQGLTLTDAIAVAEEQRAIAVARVNAEIERQVFSLQQSTELIRARETGAEASVKAEQAYTNAIRDGASEEKARALKQATWDNEQAQARARTTHETKRAGDATERLAGATRQGADAAADLAFEMELVARAAKRAEDAMYGFVPRLAGALGTQFQQSNQGGYSQFNPAGYTSTSPQATYLKMLAESRYGPDGYDPQSGAPNAQGLEYQFNQMGGTTTGIMTDRPIGLQIGQPFTPTLDMTKVGIAQRAIELMPKEQQAASIQQLIEQIEGAPRSLQSQELIASLNEKIQQLTEATEQNTSATSAMTDVLSPFYSSDPRSTHLGFRAFAAGGIMTADGMLPLRQYQGGGMATSPQVAVFGEGSTPEAYVPVPSGRIPVEIKQPANSNQRPVNVTINVMGNADQNTVAALKTTAFQQAQAMRRVTR